MQFDLKATFSALRFLLLGLLLTVTMTACITHPDPAFIANEPVMRPDNPINYHLADSSVRLIKNGNLVLRSGADAISYMLRMMNAENKNWSHCGIAFWENDSLMIYHSIGGEDNPDAHLQRDPAQRFFSPFSNERIGIVSYDLKKEEIKSLHEKATEYFRKGVKFDMDFDLNTDEKLYCSEFVFKCLITATNDSNFIPLTMTGNKKYVGIDNLFQNEHAKMICEVIYK